MKISNTEDFINKAIKKYGLKYNYSSVKYINATTKIDIICNRHGIFSQTPNHHLTGNECPKCRREKLKSNTSQFIIKSAKIHNNKYDYSKTNYVDSKTKVTIICPSHGEFSCSPNTHLNGHGCYKCGFKSNIKCGLDFIRKSSEIHNHKYSYLNVNYVNSYTKVIITCPQHGNFMQQPGNHSKGVGCQKCQREQHRSNTENFIKHANSIHGNKYDYSKTNYTYVKTKVIITCPMHGDFTQKPTHHLGGSGCPKCKMIFLKDGTSRASKIEAWYYLNFLKDSNTVYKHNGRYGLGRKRYDFYLPLQNKYIEITSFHDKYKRWGTYINNINTKRKYVEEVLGGTFEFIHRTLNATETQLVQKNIAIF